MLIHFEDQDYNMSLDDIDVSEARYLKRQTGLSLLELQEGLEKVDVDCLVALYWLMKKQSGTIVDMTKVNFPVVKFGNAIIEALTREAEKQAENPTPELVTEPATA